MDSNSIIVLKDGILQKIIEVVTKEKNAVTPSVAPPEIPNLRIADEEPT